MVRMYIALSRANLLRAKTEPATPVSYPKSSDAVLAVMATAKAPRCFSNSPTVEVMIASLFASIEDEKYGQREIQAAESAHNMSPQRLLSNRAVEYPRRHTSQITVRTRRNHLSWPCLVGRNSFQRLDLLEIARLKPSAVILTARWLGCGSAKRVQRCKAFPSPILQRPRYQNIR